MLPSTVLLQRAARRLPRGVIVAILLGSMACSSTDTGVTGTEEYRSIGTTDAHASARESATSMMRAIGCTSLQGLGDTASIALALLPGAILEFRCPDVPRDSVSRTAERIAAVVRANPILAALQSEPGDGGGGSVYYERVGSECMWIPETEGFTTWMSGNFMFSRKWVIGAHCVWVDVFAQRGPGIPMMPLETGAGPGGDGVTGPMWLPEGSAPIELEPLGDLPDVTCEDTSEGELAHLFSSEMNTLTAEFNPEAEPAAHGVSWSGMEHGPFATVDDAACQSEPDCLRDATIAESNAILDSAIASGEWRYTQGGYQGGPEPARNIATKHGDCTDYTLYAALRGLGSSFAGSWSKKLSTSMFRAWTSDADLEDLQGYARTLAVARRERVIKGGYRMVPVDSARAGDVVVQAGHAGIYLGPNLTGRPPGNHYGVANNGRPASSTGQPNVDGTTGLFHFSDPTKGPTYFFRPLIPS